MTRPRERSDPKRRRHYDIDQRAAAVELVREHGLASAARESRIPKTTLNRWAKAAGASSNAVVVSRTAAAAQAVRDRAIDASYDAVTLIEAQLIGAARSIGDLVAANQLAVELVTGLPPGAIVVKTGIAGPYAVIEDQDARDAVARLLALRATVPLRDLVGVQTRAVHDLALLNGEATERIGLIAEINPALVPPAMDDVRILELISAERASA